MGAFRRRWPGLSYGRGEDWHYVGDTSEPAFENSWDNGAASSGLTRLAFRLRESGVVDLAGIIRNGTSSTVFTLPTGYRPTYKAPGIVALSSANEAATIVVADDGTVKVVTTSSLPLAGTLAISGQFFVNPPAVA